MTFNPKDHLISLKGKDYLETKWRIAWFRDDHPQGQLLTEIVSVDPILIMKAYVQDSEGRVLATGHGTAQAKQGAVWAGREIEKAETAAIGRALGNAGYGTQFTDDDETDNLADSPISKASPPPPSANRQQTAETLGSGSQERRAPYAPKNGQQPQQSAPAEKWVYDYQKLMAHGDVQRAITVGQHRANTISWLLQQGAFNGTRDLNDAAYRITAYHAFREAGKSQDEALATMLEAAGGFDF